MDATRRRRRGGGFASDGGFMHARHDAYGIEPTIVRSFHAMRQAVLQRTRQFGLHCRRIATLRTDRSTRRYKCLQQLTDDQAPLPYRTVVSFEPLTHSKEVFMKSVIAAVLL